MVKKKISDIELARRKNQSGTATAKRDRHAAREEAKANAPFRLDYKLSLPGGILRSRYPSVIAGVIVAERESDLLRDVLSKCIEQMYAETPQADFPKVFAGLICDVLNPAGTNIRGMLAYGLMAGMGLLVQQIETTYCKVCGAEQGEVTPEPEHTGDEHEPEMTTEPAIYLDTIHKYVPLQAPKSDEDPEPEPEPEPEASEGEGEDVSESGEVPDQYVGKSNEVLSPEDLPLD